MISPQARVRVHDHFQLELKLDYPLRDAPPLRTGGRTPAQGFQAWFFFPSSLGIDEPAFGKEEFYGDIAAYIRFQTPKMSLEQLFADAAGGSPFAWLQRNEQALTSGAATPADFAMALRELRLLAAVFRANVRDESHYLFRQLERENVGRSTLDDLSDAATRFLGVSRDALKRFRGLRRRFLDARTPAGLSEALVAIDDFLSLQAIESWFRLMEGLTRHPGEATAAGVERLRAAIHVEGVYREGAGHAGALETHDVAGNERFVQRLNLLKKYVLAVLHLRLASSRRRERVQDVFFGLAAAVAMTVAVTLQLVALWTVGTPAGPQAGGTTLFAFVALAVGSYILKDRMKDRLKHWFVTGIPQWLYDRRQDLCVEAGGDTIGSVEETVRLVRTHELPPVVARLREHDEEPLFASHRADEDVVHYRRSLNVKRAKALSYAPEMTAVNEIVRFNVQRWLRRMDEPVRELYRLDEAGQVERVVAPKTYRVTLILGIDGVDGPPRYEKVAVVLSRAGIVRVEMLGAF